MLSENISNIFLAESVLFVGFVLFAQALIVQITPLRKYPLLKKFAIIIIGFIYAFIIHKITNTQKKQNSDYFKHIFWPPIIFALGKCLSIVADLYIEKDIERIKSLAVQLSVFMSIFILSAICFQDMTTLAFEFIFIVILTLFIGYFMYQSLKKPKEYPLLYSVIAGEGCLQQIIFILVYRQGMEGQHMFPQVTILYESLFPSGFGVISILNILFWGLFVQFALCKLFQKQQIYWKRSVFIKSIYFLMVQFIIYIVPKFYGQTGVIPLCMFSVLMRLHYYIQHRVQLVMYFVSFSFSDIIKLTEICTYQCLAVLIFNAQNKFTLIIYLSLSIVVAQMIRNKRRFGQAYFSQEFRDRILPELDGDSEDIICSKDWRFYVNKQWMQIIRLTEKTSIHNLEPIIIELRVLGVQSEYNNVMLKQISHIQFTHLKSLSLYGNQIQSIEGISCLSMSTVQQIEIWDNLITWLKPLNKVKWACLKSIIFSSNKLNQVCIFRAGIGKVKKMYFDEQILDMSIQVYNPNVFLKCQSNKIERLIFGRRFFNIYSQKIDECFSRRFTQPVINWANHINRENHFDFQHQQ